MLQYVLGDPDKALIFHAAPIDQQPALLQGVLDMPIFIMGSSDSAHRSAGCSTKPRDQISTFVKL